MRVIDNPIRPTVIAPRYEGDKRTYVGPVWQEDGTEFVFFNNERKPVVWVPAKGHWINN